MIKSLGQQLDPRDFLRITLGNQHAFVIIQNSDLSRPLIVTWPVLLSIIKSNIDAGTGTSFSVNDEGIIIQNDPTFLNFTGAGVTVTQSTTGVQIDIPGGGSSFITSISDTADIDLSVTASDLSATLTTTGVTANTYGSSTQVPQITVDSKGRITGVTLVNITAGSGTVTSVGTGTGLTGGTITGAGTVSLNSKLAPADSLTGNALKYLRVNAGETAVEYATASSSGGILHGTTSGTDTYTVTITGATAYADGDAYLIRFAIGNTTSATLNINGQGAIPLYRNNDGPLLGGDVIAGGEMICVYNSTLNIFQCIGISPNSLIAYVTNDDSVTITKGQPVYAFSGTGDRMTVKLAYNTGDSTSAQTVGLVLSTSIAANQKGLIMMQGLLDGLSNVKPANGWADGSPVYLGTTAGSITPTKQYAPNHLVYLGFVTTASPGAAGRVYVRVQNGFELDELHNVQAQTPANNDTLYYDNVTTPLKPQWKVASIATILGYTPLSQTLADTQLFVGNASNVATAVPMSGDATIANTGAVTIANNAVTYAKMQSVSATSKLLGSSSTTTPVQEITIGGGLTLTGTTLTASFLITYRRLTSSSTLDSTDLTNVNTGTTYIIEMNVGSANTLTVPLNATIGFSIGSQITISQYGAGQTTIAAAVGVTLRSPGSFLKLAAQYSMCTLMKVDTNEWYVVGQLAP